VKIINKDFVILAYAVVYRY